MTDSKAQSEFNAILERRENFADRMNVCLRLKPLDFTQMRRMIEHRIAQASQAGHESVEFTTPALAAIYLATGGVPRKVVMLCHQVILAMIVRNRSRAGWFLVQSCLRSRASHGRRRRSIGWGMAAALGVAALAVLTGIAGKRDVAGEPGDRTVAAYQARVSDKTVYSLDPVRAVARKPAAIYIRSSRTAASVLRCAKGLTIAMAPILPSFMMAGDMVNERHSILPDCVRAVIAGVKISTMTRIRPARTKRAHPPCMEREK